MGKEAKKSDSGSQKMYHWTDFTAEKVIREKGDKGSYTVASGITPSGVVHIGNFREIMTVELVKRALEKRGKKVRFIYSWDDYDVFRKVPKGMPQQEMLQGQLRRPIVDVPDPHGKEESYARYHEKQIEEAVKLVGIDPEFIYQSKRYRSRDYAKEMKFALDHAAEIREILNQFRENPLDDSWLPIGIFSKKFGTDVVSNVRYDGEWSVSYDLEDGTTETVDLRKDGNVKLKWRVDWPMRWNFEQVDYEPGGKDHSTAGGSFDTGKQIIQKLWKRDAPTYIMYDFVRIKGQGGKISSSKGNVVTLYDVLEVYEPEIVRYLFAGTRPNREFAISFDVDVIAMYEDFDRCERVYFGVENGKISDKDREKLKVAYELSAVGEVPKEMPYQPSFRHLTTILQINALDVDKTVGYYEKELKNDFDRKRLRTRATCAANWLKKYAPKDFTFSVQEECSVELSDSEMKLFSEIASKLVEKEWTDTALHEEMYILAKNNGVPVKDFFRQAYRILVGKEKGPRLASFILEIGRERVAGLLEKAVA